MSFCTAPTDEFFGFFAEWIHKQSAGVGNSSREHFNSFLCLPHDAIKLRGKKRFFFREKTFFVSRALQSSEGWRSTPRCARGAERNMIHLGVLYAAWTFTSDCFSHSAEVDSREKVCSASRRKFKRFLALGGWKSDWTLTVTLVLAAMKQSLGNSSSSLWRLDQKLLSNEIKFRSKTLKLKK